MVNVEWFLALGGWCVLGHLVDGKGIEITRCTIRIGLEFQGDSLSRYRGSHHQQYEYTNMSHVIESSNYKDRYFSYKVNGFPQDIQIN